MLKRSIIISLLMVGNAVHALSDCVSQQLDNYMQALTQLNRFSGTVLVAKGDTILLNKGYGYASHEFAVPNTPQTRFKICSITKMVTAVAILQLQEKGVLRVSDPIARYLPDYPRGNEITIHHLLSHTSGVSSANLPLEMIVCPATLEQIIDHVKNQPLEYEPGSDYRYSNAGYALLSVIIEKVSGKKYEAYIQDHILEPLQMHESFFRVQNYEILKNCATGYCFNEANRLINGHYVYENFRGSGGLFCTTHDLYRFGRALVTGKLINNDSLQVMCTSYHHQANYGYGCQKQQLQQHTFIEHGGMLSSGYKTNLSLFINDDVCIVIFSNIFQSWVNEARDALAAIMLNLPHDIPTRDPITLDAAVYEDYIGNYEHPAFVSGYHVTKKGDSLLLPDNIELSPVAPDQCMALHQNRDNMVYKFVRNETGQVVQLRIKGGGPYFEIRCDKINKEKVLPN